MILYPFAALALATVPEELEGGWILKAMIGAFAIAVLYLCIRRFFR